MQEKKQILVIEDSNEDFEAFARAVERNNFQAHITRCKGPAEALEYIQRKGAYGLAHAPIPDLVVMDFYLPGLYGHELIAELRQVKTWEKVPVVVLTTTDEKQDIQLCKSAGATYVITKPHNFQGYVDDVRQNLSKYLKI